VQAFYNDYKARYGKDPASYVAVIGYDEVNLVAQAITAAGGTDPAALKDQLAHADYTGISGHVVMDPTTRRANKPASLIQMQGTTFTCLGVQPFPSFVAPPAG
jgi:branched-chain amino acid transport system substrate-binding protein